MRFALALLVGGAMLPSLVAAQQQPPSTTQHCETNRQNCIRRCTGPDLQLCFASCAENHAYCIRNPIAAQRQQQQQLGR